MMRILFCNIAWMKEYRGNEDGKDTPLNGGSYVDETGDAHEKYQKGRGNHRRISGHPESQISGSKGL